MQIGMVGLGRMGGNMARRLMRGGHKVVAWARNPKVVQEVAGEGAVGTMTLDDFVAKLAAPRVAWVMVPAGAARQPAGKGPASPRRPRPPPTDGRTPHLQGPRARHPGARAGAEKTPHLRPAGGVLGLDA